MVYASKFNGLENIGVAIGISTIYCLDDEMHEPALRVDR